MSVKIVCARGHLLAVTKALDRSRLYASFVYCINGRLEKKRKKRKKKKKLDGFLPAYHIVARRLVYATGRQPKVWAQDISNSSRIAVAIQSRRVVDVSFSFPFTW